MKYAVIKVQGKQYKVKEKEEILVDRIKDKKPEIDVLLVVNGEKVEIGKPTLGKTKVKVKLLEEKKGKKITIQKYKAKSRYRKKIGFRPIYSKLLIEKIG